MDDIKKGGFFFLVKIAYRNIFRNFRRSTLCMIAISIAVFVSIFLSGFMEGMIDALKGDIISYETAHLSINSMDYENKKIFNPVWFPLETGEPLDETLKKISEVNGVEKVIPKIKTYASVQDNFVKNAVIWGIDIKDEIAFHKKTKLAYFNQRTKDANDCLVDGRLPDNGKNECIVGIDLAKKMKVRVGDKITMKLISSQLSDKFIKPEIVGIFDFDFNEIDRTYIIMPFDKIQKILNLTDKTTMLFVYADNIKKTDVISNSIKEMYGGDEIKINKWNEHYWMVFLKGINVMMSIIYIAFFIVASFLIINTIIMAIHERMKEIGMMGALGMNRREIVIVFFNEAVILSLFGSLIGVIVGGGLTFLISLFPIDASAMTGNSMPISNTLYVKFSFLILLTGFLYGLGVSTVCTIFPSLKAAFVEPVEALRR